jgi:uncharacterized protein YjbI with pentapeptide repeats
MKGRCLKDEIKANLPTLRTSLARGGCFFGRTESIQIIFSLKRAAMKYLLGVLVPALIFLFLLQVLPASGQEKKEKEPWKGKLADGTVLFKQDLDKILEEHKKWVETNGKEGRQALLRGANLTQALLQGANLTKAVLTKANLSEADLRGANLTLAALWDANLTKADLWKADLTEARLNRTNLTEALMQEANLTRSVLRETNLTGAFLYQANLTRAYLGEANLNEALLKDVNLTEVVYEPKPGSLPYIPSMIATKNLSNLTFRNSSHGLIELREEFKKAGLREQERQVTYAIEHTKRVKLTSENPFSSLLSKKEEEERSFIEKLGREIIGWIYYVFVELTCNYGMSPWRPLLFLIFVSIPFFTIPYVIFLSKQSEDGIWKVWNPERVRKDLGKANPELVSLRGFAALRTALYFSLLSAFSIGWRELNVGNWISRVQRREYNLRASGWVRTVSGIQSLLSVYLLALWALTYFSRPFE